MPLFNSLYLHVQLGVRGISNVPGLQDELDSIKNLVDDNSHICSENDADLSVIKQHVNDAGVHWSNLSNLSICSEVDHGVLGVDGTTIQSVGGVITCEIDAAIKLVTNDEIEMTSLGISDSMYIVTRLDVSKIFYLNPNQNPAIITNWVSGPTLLDLVTAFNGRNGNVIPEYGDYAIDDIPMLRDTLNQLYDDVDDSTVTTTENNTRVSTLLTGYSALADISNATADSIATSQQRITYLKSSQPREYSTALTAYITPSQSGSNIDDARITSQVTTWEGGLQVMLLYLPTYWRDGFTTILFQPSILFSEILDIQFAVNYTSDPTRVRAQWDYTYTNANRDRYVSSVILWRDSSIDGNTPQRIRITGIPLNMDEY